MQGPMPTAASGPAEKSKTGKVVAISVIAALGGFLFGYDSAVINGANQAVFETFNITDGFIEGVVVAIALLGSAVGAFVGGRLADKMGRKKVMLIAACLFAASGIGTGLPFSEIDFMFWRLVGGFAIGLAAVVSPMYISEVAPAHLRGRLSSLFQMAIVTGIFTTSIVNKLLLEAAGGETARGELWFGFEAWQWMFFCMVFPSIIYFLLAFTLPETPRYLVARQRFSEAKAVLESVLVGDQSAKVDEIKVSLERDDKPSMRDLRGSTLGLKPIVWIGIIIAVLQQFVGINAVFYYSNLVWSSVGFETSEAFLTSTITTIVNVVFTVVAILLIDKVGRKPLLLIGSLGMFVTLGIMTILFVSAPQTAAGPDLGAAGTGMIAVLCMNAFVAFFATTWGPIVWVLLGEMFPNRFRAAALSIGVMSNWIANFVVSTTFPELVQVSLGLAYGLFTFFALVSFFFVLKFVKETKGVQLEDMEKLEASQT